MVRGLFCIRHYSCDFIADFTDFKLPIRAGRSKPVPRTDFLLTVRTLSELDVIVVDEVLIVSRWSNKSKS